METTAYLNGKPVTVIGPSRRGEVLIQKDNGMVLSIFKTGLSTTPPREMTAARLTVNTTYGTDGAR